ncbi:unnamed protein product [Closterium sp. Naga37s-1]|nr:unnamed protein product [Closterium sp. Naga37s-1]
MLPVCWGNSAGVVGLGGESRESGLGRGHEDRVAKRWAKLLVRVGVGGRASCAHAHQQPAMPLPPSLPFTAVSLPVCPTVLDQAEQTLVYSLVFEEGVVNGATSFVLFRAVQLLVL